MGKMYKNALLIFVALGVIAAYPAAGQSQDYTMVISPRVLCSNNIGDHVNIHTEIAYSDVDLNSFVLCGVGCIDDYRTESDLKGNVVVKFSSDDVWTIVKPGMFELTLTGNYLDGTGFELLGSIMVKK